MILIVASEFDKSEDHVIEALITSATEALASDNVPYRVIRVPGAIEIPVAIQHFMDQDPDIEATIALGCVIRGESDHYGLVAQSVTHGLTQLALDQKKPIIQGVLACHTPAQARARKNLGAEFAYTACTMMQLLKC